MKPFTPFLKRSSRLLASLVVAWMIILGTFAVVSSRSLLEIHIENRILGNISLPSLPNPSAKDHLLILAPHPDDEILGCGGLIQRALRRRARVTVVIVTNGDAFTPAVMRYLKVMRPKPADFIRFGEIRQEESLRALESIGLPREQVIFLSFPDRGLATLWSQNWSPLTPYRSRRTQSLHSPYPLSYQPGVLYCGESLLQNLITLITNLRPTQIYFPHPNDDHIDHWALSCFVTTALIRLKEEKQLPHTPQLYTYLIHRGDWPVPQGLAPQRKLGPPEALLNMDTSWKALLLNPEEVQRKREALQFYRTQIQILFERRFMNSFVRKTELFGEIPLAIPLKPGKIVEFPDPTEDKVSRDIEPGGDISKLTVQRFRNHLLIGIRLRGTLKPWILYRVRLHRVEPGEPQMVYYDYPQGRQNSTPCRWSKDRKELEVVIPLRSLHSPRYVMVSADTLTQKLTIDRTAWRGVLLEPKE